MSYNRYDKDGPHLDPALSLQSVTKTLTVGCTAPLDEHCLCNGEPGSTQRTGVDPQALWLDQWRR